VGEETGRLDELLVEAADSLDREAQGTLDRLLSVMVPSITIAMGAIVAGLIASVLVGILSLNDLAFDIVSLVIQEPSLECPDSSGSLRVRGFTLLELMVVC